MRPVPSCSHSSSTSGGCPFLTQKARQAWVQALVIWRLECDEQNAAALLVLNRPTFSHTRPLLCTLHWPLPSVQSMVLLYHAAYQHGPIIHPISHALTPSLEGTQAASRYIQVVCCPGSLIVDAAQLCPPAETLPTFRRKLIFGAN